MLRVSHGRTAVSGLMLADMLIQLLMFIGLLILLDVAALRWGFDSRSAAWLHDSHRPDLW